MRTSRHALGILVCRWLAAFAVCWISLSAHAAVEWRIQNGTANPNWVAPGGWYPSSAAACNGGDVSAYLAFAQNNNTLTFNSIVSVSEVSGRCTFAYTVCSTSGGCQGTQTWLDLVSRTAVSVCEAKTGQTAGIWDFNTGRTEAQGGDSSDRYICEPAAGQAATVGCTIKIDVNFGYVGRIGPYAGMWMARGVGAYTGGQCNPTVDGSGLGSGTTTSTAPPGTPTPKVAPSPCPTGTYPGTVNGVEVCAPPVAGAPTLTETKTTTGKTVVAPGGGTTTDAVTETTSTVCSGAGSCTTTTTTNVTNSGGTTTTTQTKTTDKGTFCAANGSDQACRGQEDELGPIPSGTVPTSSTSLTYTAETPFGGGACPADKFFTSGMTGQTYKAWNWAQTCSYTATYIRPMVILLATFAAFLILMPGKVET
jgi:hypothetical protein